MIKHIGLLYIALQSFTETCLLFLQSLYFEEGDAFKVSIEVLHEYGDNVESLCLAKECVALEECLVVSCGKVKLLQREYICSKVMKKELLQKDCAMNVEKCKEKPL